MTGTAGTGCRHAGCPDDSTLPCRTQKGGLAGIFRIWRGRTRQADADDCQQALDAQATGVMARRIAGLRSIDITRRDTGDDEVEFCTILRFDDRAAVRAFAGADHTAAAGAQHFAIDIADLNGQPGWYIGQNGDFFITNETDTFTGHGGPPVTVFDAFPPYPHDLGIPAAPGHYDTTHLFGFPPPPGVTFQIQVTQVPG